MGSESIQVEPIEKPLQALCSHRLAVRLVVEARHASNVRVFGSVARGLDTKGSDLDLLVDPTQDTTMLEIGAIRIEWRQLLGVMVNVVTPHALPAEFRAAVVAESRPVWAGT